MKPCILVIGSSNTDMVVKANRLPVPGETVLGGAFLMAAGGKGANQAVAAARLGGEIVFIAKVGKDIFGEQAVESFKREGIDTSFIVTDPVNPSGVALITVDAHAENCIVVASGANGTLMPADLQPAEEKIKNASLILVQLEIPLITVEYIADLAAKNQVPLILNPAPACALSEELLSKVSIITPNQKEAEMLTGLKINDNSGAENAARALAAKGIDTVIITMGAKGAIVYNRNEIYWIAAPAVKAVDTTAAGDVFNGALTVALSEGKTVKEAVTFASAAAALSVTKMGAQTSAPTSTETEEFLKSLAL